MINYHYIFNDTIKYYFGDEFCLPIDSCANVNTTAIEATALDEYLDTALAVSYSKEYDAFTESGEGLLIEICSHSDGIVTSDISKLTAIEMDSVETVKDPLIPIALICAALMLIDLIIRLLRVKDIKEFLRRFNTKQKA